jgi:hypothetical protein
MLVRPGAELHLNEFMQRLDLPPCSDSPELNTMTVRQYFEVLAGMEMNENARLLALARRMEARIASEDGVKHMERAA